MSREEIATRALVLTTIVAIVVGGYSLIPHLRAERFTPVLLDPPLDGESAKVTVDVSGDVAYPGLYTVDASTSLADVLRIALAQQDELPDTVSLTIAASAGECAPQRVDLNHADAWLLDALPGIGPDRAKAIVDYRDRNGPFSSAQELVMVPGFGNATYEALKEFVTVTP